MEFGTWVQNIRKERDLNIRALAEKTGIDPSTISRIENLKTEATFYTAFSICESLEVTPTDLFPKLTERTLGSLQSGFSQNSKSPIMTLGNQILTLQDVEKFVNDFLVDRANVCERLANDLTYLSNKLASSKKISKRNFTAVKIHPFTPGEIDRFLFSSPLYWNISLNYPSGIKEKDIIFNFEQGAALLREDVMLIIVRHSIGTNNRQLVSLHDKLNLVSTKYIKLIDVIEFDLKSEQDGRIIRMFWEFCKFNKKFTNYHPSSEYRQLTFSDLPRYSSNEQLSFSNLAKHQFYNQLSEHERRIRDDSDISNESWVISLAKLYVTINRWYQYLDGDESN